MNFLHPLFCKETPDKIGNGISVTGDNHTVFISTAS